MIEVANEYALYLIGDDGLNHSFVDLRTGTDYCVQNPRSHFATIRKTGHEYPATSAERVGENIAVEFGESGVSALVRITAEKHYFVMQVMEVQRKEEVEQLVFADLRLTIKGTAEEPFAACALALNLQTNVPELPHSHHRLRAICYSRFTFAGAKVALIGCPQEELRTVMQEAVRAAPDLPHSPLGGPWALDAEINQGSYLFNHGGLTEETAGEWINLAKSIGFTQIDFHGGGSFRFGDCVPNPTMYPCGRKSLKAVIDKLHEAGIAAGLHTYAFFIDKSCPWVTPVPDRRLGTDSVFTLAEAISPDTDAVTVVESTEDMSAITGFFVRNSVTLRIDDELITYSNVSKHSPYAFTGCRRGACGSRPTPHAKGATVHHLKECFGLFAPDGDSSLLTEIATRTADTFNECGFDMMYLDALDGEDILAGPENAWHYGSKFVFELWKRLERPALMEMSTFHHHLWFVRSRMGAWDNPSRSHKKHIDNHCAYNEHNRRMFLPGHLGWWAVLPWSGPDGEPTYPDDIEYLCCKAIGTETGFSLMGISPDSLAANPGMRRLADIIRQYEKLRHANYFSDSVKARLRAPGEEFTLVQSSDGKWRVRPVQYAKHKVEGLDVWSRCWRTVNKFGAQPVQLRIEALMAAGPYDAPDNVTVADFGDPREFRDQKTARGVETGIEPSLVQTEDRRAGGRYFARNADAEPIAAWTMIQKTFSPPLDLGQRQALGLLVCGDGQGEVLNCQLRSPIAVSNACGEHYIVIDFTGWRYFELIEPEGERFQDYRWPYMSPPLVWDSGEETEEKSEEAEHWINGYYHIYRQSVRYDQVESISLWYTNLPRNREVACIISPIRALPLVTARIRHPAVTVGDKTIVFPVEMESGQYLEFHGPDDCTLYAPDGNVIGEVQPQGETPVLAAGENKLMFTCNAPGGYTPRTRVTIISHGEML